MLPAVSTYGNDILQTMKFVYASPETGVSEISEAINAALQKGSVLLLVSGGSNIRLAVDVRQKLTLANQLTLGLIDERYGPVGHPDSNWTQLLNAGLDLDGIRPLPVMVDSRPHAEAAKDYRQRLQAAANQHDTVIGIFGIGGDGHTSGILPDSPAVTASDIVIGFTGHDFERITTTPAAMPLFNQAYLASFNESKHGQLARLKETLPVNEQPAQALKQIENLVIYSDYKDGDR